MSTFDGINFRPTPPVHKDVERPRDDRPRRAPPPDPDRSRSFKEVARDDKKPTRDLASENRKRKRDLSDATNFDPIDEIEESEDLFSLASKEQASKQAVKKTKNPNVSSRQAVKKSDEGKGGKDESYNIANAIKEDPSDSFTEENAELLHEKNMKKPTAPKTEVESPFSLYKKLSTVAKAPTDTRQPAFSQEPTQDLHMPVSKEDSKKNKNVGRFQQEESDLSYVNPLSAPVNSLTAINDSSQKIEAAASASLNLKLLVEEVVKQLYIIEKAGQTETVVVLNDPKFQDARLIVTEFNSARREFNLAFENLTGPAKKILDDNINALRLMLQDQGNAHAIHIVTTTTLIEHYLPGDGARQQGDRDQDNPNKDRQQKDRRGKEEDIA